MSGKAGGGIDDFVNELVQVHLKQLDPEATDDIEKASSMGITEIIFLCIVLAIVCFVVADFIYPYIPYIPFLKKKKKRVLPVPKKKK
mmetsp:Transcript_12141/g.27545  ORF Transcript_12141/g.27545 Transcript_12141/m.27545 type:complete len:87 (+) Transcript_12141:130-390(+)